MPAQALPNGGTHQRRERYADKIVTLLRKKNVTLNGMIFGNEYEGDPKAGAVQVPLRDIEAFVSNYNIALGANLAQSNTTYLQIPLDTDKAVNEIIDKYEASAVPDNLQAQRLDSAAYALGNTIDTDRITTLESEGTTSTNVTQSTDTTAYSNFLDENEELDLADVPSEDRWALVSPNFYKLLKKDNNFISAASDTGTGIKITGLVGEVDGVRIFKCNNMDANTEFILGHQEFAQAIIEWASMPEIVNLTNEYIGSSAVQARMIYNQVVTRPTAVRVKTFI
jgi:hypothetical protein